MSTFFDFKSQIFFALIQRFQNALRDPALALARINEPPAIQAFLNNKTLYILLNGYLVCGSGGIIMNT